MIGKNIKLIVEVHNLEIKGLKKDHMQHVKWARKIEKGGEL